MLSLIAALVLAAGPLPERPAETRGLAGIELTYHHPRWREVVECPGRSKLALHGECWSRVDVLVPENQCNQPLVEVDEDTVRRGGCPEPKPTFGG